jgi:hypothetical protein
MLDGQIAEQAEALPLDTLIAIVGRVALKDGQPDADERWKRYNDLLPKLRQAMNLPERRRYLSELDEGPPAA